MIADTLVAVAGRLLIARSHTVVLVRHHHHQVDVVVARIRVHYQLRLGQALDAVKFSSDQVLNVLREYLIYHFPKLLLFVEISGYLLIQTINIEVYICDFKRQLVLVLRQILPLPLLSTQLSSQVLKLSG